MHEQNYAAVSRVSCTMALLLPYLPFGYSGMHKQFKCRQVTFLHVVLYTTIWHASFLIHLFLKLMVRMLIQWLYHLHGLHRI